METTSCVQHSNADQSGWPLLTLQQAYPILARQVYALANSGALPSIIAGTVLRNLLKQLSEDAPIFFTSIWTDPASSSTLRVTALRHISAFIAAYKSQSKGIDMQMIIPALLVALQDEVKEVRSAAVAVMKAVADSGKHHGEEVYAVDSFYGKHSGMSISTVSMPLERYANLVSLGSVQLLKPSYLDRYLSHLLAHATDLILDPRRLGAVHADQLSNHASTNKKDKGISRAIIASLCSHLVAWRALSPRLLILQSLAAVREHAVLKGVMPLISPLSENSSEESAWLASLSASERATYLDLLLARLDKHSAPLLASPESEVWKLVESLFTTAVSSRESPRYESDHDSLAHLCSERRISAKASHIAHV